MTKDEALKLALEALELHGQQYPHMVKGYCLDAITAIREALAEQPAQPKRCQCPACKIAPHASDCPVHNEPAWPNGLCDCGAQPEQEPVAWESLLGAIARGWCYEKNANKTMDVDLAVAIAKEVDALYTTPPQREWQGLTYEEAVQIIESFYGDEVDMLRSLEAKLKEKNT